MTTPEPARRHPMTQWYDPVPLARTAVRVAVSSVFGAFADRRELVAAVNPIAEQPFDPVHDYSQRSTDGAFWFDFLADTGDGWASTHAVAQMVTAPHLDFGGQVLPRGQLLMLGGDQVYPTASTDAYQERFIEPWTAAAREIGQDPASADLGDLYAVPGNHDWYDGLIAFSHIFARRNTAVQGLASVEREGKIIAGRQTRQVRSYFALRLPHDWWLWGTDSQLDGFIDQPQVDFFRFVARSWMAPGSKLILSVGQPSWTYVDPDRPARDFNSFSFLSRLATTAVDPAGKPMGHRLKLVLTGDAHHYSRYTEHGCQYVTAGGGGAFLHPTHHLRETIGFKWDFPAPNEPALPKGEKADRRFELARREPVAAEDQGDRQDETFAVYPRRATSRGLTWRNLGFAAYNPQFAGIYLGFYVLLLWALEQRLAGLEEGGLLATVTRNGQAHFGGALCDFAKLALGSPWTLTPLLLTLAIYVYFADERNSLLLRWGIGLAHGLAQLAAFQALAAASLLLFARHGGIDWDKGPTWLPMLIGDGLAAGVAAIGAATVFGLYLLVCLRFFNRHWNEAFSSLRIRHHKNFLRLCITEDGLVLYPIGLDAVPAEDAPAQTLRPHLIEGAIHIE